MKKEQSNKENSGIGTSNSNEEIPNQTYEDDIIDKVYKMNFKDRSSVKVCEKIDTLFFYLSSEGGIGSDTSVIKEKIKSGILRLKVLNADIEAKHYEERLNKHKKKNKTILIITITAAIGLPLLVLLIDYFTGGEFLATPEIKLPFWD